MTINDIEALTFETIQGYEESKGVAKNRNTRYRTAKYMATNSKGQEHEYKVRVNNAGQPATIVDLGVTRAGCQQPSGRLRRPQAGNQTGARGPGLALAQLLPKGDHRGRH